MTDDSRSIDTLRIDSADRAASRSVGRGRRRSVPRWLIVLGVLGLGGGAFGILSGRSGAPVTTATVTVREQKGPTVVLEASGYVTARRQATVSSKVTGKVVEVMIEEGMKVEEGQVLARLEDINGRRQFDLISAQLDSAKSSLSEIRVRINEAELNLKRTRRLVAENITDQAALDRDQATLEALRARLASQQDQVAVAERTLALERQNLEDLVIRAPFTGVAISKNAQPGEMISPNSAGGGFTRTGISTIVDMSSLEIEVDVSESYLNRVKPGMKLGAVLDSYPDWTIPGFVITTIPAADRQKATVKVRVGFDQLDPRILPDMGVKVSFYEDSDGTRPERIFAPRAAITRDGTDDVAFVVVDRKVKRSVVKLGPVQEGDDTSIESGLQPGQVVVVGPKDLQDGARVTLAAAPEKAGG